RDRQRAGLPLRLRSQDSRAAGPDDQRQAGDRRRHRRTPCGEIEYVFRQPDSVPKVTWTDADRRLSDQMMTYWSNFAKTGDPNGSGLPQWPAYDSSAPSVLHLDVEVAAKPDTHRPRYLFLDSTRNSAASQ